MGRVLQDYDVLQESIRQEEAIRIIGKYDPRSKYLVKKKIYYPYQFVSYYMKVKALLVNEGYLGCTIDMISGCESLIDSKPHFIKKHATDEEWLKPIFTKEHAERNAIDFFQRHASKKYKFLTVPHFTLQDSILFFRPFWVVASQEHQFIVDGLSGKYHLLP